MHGASFRIDAGRTLALAGESGFGKTTTAKAVVQLLRDQAASGEALLDGRDLFGLQGEALMQARRAIQVVFRDPFASFDPRMRRRCDRGGLMDRFRLAPRLAAVLAALALHALALRVLLVAADHRIGDARRPMLVRIVEDSRPTMPKSSAEPERVVQAATRAAPARTAKPQSQAPKRDQAPARRTALPPEAAPAPVPDATAAPGGSQVEPTHEAAAAEPQPASSGSAAAGPPAAPGPAAGAEPAAQAIASVACPGHIQAVKDAGFPREAMRAGLEKGLVTLKLTIDARGRVRDVQVVSATHRAFHRAAIDAARRIVCRGQGREVETLLPIEYQVP